MIYHVLQVKFVKLFLYVIKQSEEDYKSLNKQV